VSSTASREWHATLWTPAPGAQIDSLLAQVRLLREAGALSRGQEVALTKTLERAQEMLAQGRLETACNALRTFLRQVRAFTDEAEGRSLIDAATNLMAQLCG
jgi:hypothetical protein